MVEKKKVKFPYLNDYKCTKLYTMVTMTNTHVWCYHCYLLLLACKPTSPHRCTTKVFYGAEQKHHTPLIKSNNYKCVLQITLCSTTQVSLKLSEARRKDTTAKKRYDRTHKKSVNWATQHDYQQSHHRGTRQEATIKNGRFLDNII